MKNNINKLMLKFVASLLILTSAFLSSSYEAKASSNQIIYSDYLTSNWSNWSWGASINYDNPAPTQSGNRSIWTSLSPWGALYFHSGSKIDLTQYSNLTLAIQSGEWNEKFNILIYDGNDNLVKTLPLNNYGSLPNPTGYTIYKIPVTDMAVTESKGFAIQDSAGYKQAPFFVDTIELLAKQTSDSYSTPMTGNNVAVYDDNIDNNWINWSWNGNTNYFSTNKVYRGNNSLEFAPYQAWSAIYLHTDKGLDTTNINYLHFAVNNNSPKLQIVLYDTSNSKIGDFVLLDNFTPTSSSNDWKIYDIPLENLNGAKRIINGLAFQDASGYISSAFNIDEIKFTNSITIENPLPSTINDNIPSMPGFTSYNNKIYKDGTAVYLHGVNWFGFETNTFAPHGLWLRNYKDMITQIKNSGFNAVRVPVNPQTLSGVPVSGIDYSINPDLKGQNSLQVLDKIINEINNQGLYVLLDHHRPDSNAISELWYTNTYSEDQWINDLKFMAIRYKNLSNFIGIDLKNEPHGSATWGTSNTSTDWNLAAERAGKQVLLVNSNILIFVEGVSNNPVCSSSYTHGWGINLEAERCSPISTASIPANKLVLSPHIYGPDVYNQSYFSDPTFPNNMPNIWDTQFGSLSADLNITIIPGEWGSKYGTQGGLQSDVTFQNKLVEYMKSKGICNSFYWSWNPNSGDTGGILQDDWINTWSSKLNLVNNYYNSCK